MGRAAKARLTDVLKTWISKHPEALGLRDVKSVKLEHRYTCGDSADIVFEHESGGATVVEIETNNPHPGAHQAIKYRALQCAEKGLPLNAENVKTFLVAWSVPGELGLSAENYGVAWHEHRLPEGARRSSKS